MVGFGLTDEQRALQEAAHQYARDIVRPAAATYDRTGEFPREELKAGWARGLMNEVVPDAYGGLGLSLLDLCIIEEELGWGCVGFWTSMTVNNLALNAVVLFGNDEQKERILPRFVNEFHMASFCLSEPGTGSDAGSLATTATRRGDHYILNGTKQWVTNGGEASLFTVFATLDRNLKHKGITCFVVDRDTPGLIIGKKEDKMGQRTSDTRQIIFENCAVPIANRVGEDGGGFRIAMTMLDRSRPTIAAGAVGIARAALEHAQGYAKERQQFGKAIADFQGIQFMLADIAKDLEASRLLTWQAAWRIEQGMKASKYSSMAKCFATDTAMKAAIDAVQIFGGYGYTKEYPVEKLMRDAKVMQIYEGTNQVQRNIIAREVLAGN